MEYTIKLQTEAPKTSQIHQVNDFELALAYFKQAVHQSWEIIGDLSILLIRNSDDKVLQKLEKAW